MADKKPTLADQLGNALPIISSTARTAFVASHFILALGSGLAIMYLVIGAVGGNLSTGLAYLLAWAGSMVWYRAIENPLRKYILFAWAWALTTKDEAKDLTSNMVRAGKASVFVAGLLLVVTLSLSLMINVDVAQAITTEADSDDEIEHADAVVSSYDKDVALLNQQVNDAVANDTKALVKAKEEADAWLKTAQDRQGVNLGNLVRAGNKWAPTQYTERTKRAITRARTRGEQHIAKAKEALTEPAARAALAAYVTNRSAARDTVVTSTTLLVTGRRADYLGNVSRRNWMLFVAVCFVLAVFVFTARLLVITCLETGENFDDDHGEGVIKVAARKAGQLNAYLGSKLDERFGDKFVVAPAIMHTKPVPVVPTKSIPLRTVLRTEMKAESPSKVKTKPARTKKLSAKSSSSLSAKLSANLSVGNGDKLVITITDDKGTKDYTARQAGEKVRRYYERWKGAAKKSTGDRNKHRYKQLKAVMASHFTFDEKESTVSVKQK